MCHILEGSFRDFLDSVSAEKSEKKQYNLHLFYLFNQLKIVQLRWGVCVGGDLYFNVACSGGLGLGLGSGVFFERAICSRHVETSRREEEMGPVLAPTVRVTISTLPNLPLS